MPQPDAVVAGHICLDMIPDLPPIDVRTDLRPGAVIEIGPAILATGGPVSNTGRNLHRLGIRTRLMGKVGDDDFGRIVLHQLRDDDPALADHMIVTPGETTSYSVVFSPPGHDRTFLHCAGANATFGADDVRYDQMAGARLFHFGYPPIMARMVANGGAELVTMYRRAKAAGAITSLDTAMPDPKGLGGQVDWPAVFARTLPHVDIFLPSLDELVVMLRGHMPAADPPDDALLSTIAAEMLALGAWIVVLKLGDRGLYLRTGPEGVPFLRGAGWRSRELWAPCFEPQPLVGTTGAGDATIAGFLAGILRGQSPEEALTSAVAVGACNVEAADALSGVRPWDETQARVAAGWGRQPVTITAPGWTWDDAHSLWVGPHDER